ncbi:GntR family transcriptional regulator [Streptacidiphilus sp. MAP5-3]|uniref:GntR family transcriptional regulator n=1 Tax=unclassified Streptacidiphilus TaxID=2643834 RepID=UPI003511688E
MVSKRVQEQLEQRIAEGTWQPGESLPSAQQLAEDLKVSRLTVQKALTALARDGLIVTRAGKPAVLTGARPRRPAADADAGTEEETNGPADGYAGGPSDGAVDVVDVLERRLGRALRSRRLRVDVLSATSESFVAALQQQLLGLRARRGPVLEEFRVRLLFCDFSGLPTFPRVLGDPDDHRPIARLRRIGQDQVTMLRSAANSLQTFRLVENEPLIEARTLPFPPMAQLYLVNDDEVLEGWYELRERQVEVGGHRRRLADLTGLSTPLFVRTRHSLPNHVDSAYVDAAQVFFDSWWSQGEPYGVSLHR